MLTVRFTSPAGPPPMDFQPVVRFDPKADRILIATRPALFDSVLAGKEKIALGADFTQAWRDLPSDGNTCIYASSRLLQTISDLVAKSAQTASASASDAALTAKIFDWVKPLLSRGQALVIANQPDGVFAASNSSIPVGSSTMTAVSTVAVLAGMALPAITKVRLKAVETSELNTLKQVLIGLRMYAADNNGKYPPTLSALAPDYVGGSQILEFTDPRTKQRTPWLYRNSLTEASAGSEVLVAAPVASPDRKRAVGFNDGSVRVIPEAEFQMLWSRK